MWCPVALGGYSEGITPSSESTRMDSSSVVGRFGVGVDLRNLQDSASTGIGI